MNEAAIKLIRKLRGEGQSFTLIARALSARLRQDISRQRIYLACKANNIPKPKKIIRSGAKVFPKKKCLTCKKEFELRASNKNRLFCDRKCYANAPSSYRKKREMVCSSKLILNLTCANCATKFKRPQQWLRQYELVRKGPGKQKFYCSQKCYRDHVAVTPRRRIRNAS